MKITRLLLFSFAILTVAVLPLACSDDGATPPPAGADGGNTAPYGTSYEPRSDSGVDVIYFEESNACDCMAEVGVVIKETVASHFASELKDGTLRFFVLTSDDWANREAFEMFKNQSFDLFIVAFEDGRGIASPVTEFWTMIGDDEAIELYVAAQIAESLSEY